jgi:GT2 family glycosyltransferase
MNINCHVDVGPTAGQPLVSIIIVTYNSASVLENCLSALCEQSYHNYETIVVDNCSTDTTVDIIGKFPGVRLVQAGNNLGFTGGNILGLTHARGEFIVLLNPDTEPCTMWLAALVRGIVSDSRVGICASKLIVHGTDMVDSAGDGITTTGRGFKRGDGQAGDLFNQQEYVFGACGGAMLLRRALIAEIGFLDDDFFLIHEDTDLNFRARLAGWQCLFVPEAVVYHKVRSTIGVMSDLAVYYSIRNARFVWVKNMPLKLLVKYLHHHVVQEIGSFIYFCLKYRKWRAYWRANIDFLRLLPLMLRKRRQVRKLKKITDRELEKWQLSLFSRQLLGEKLYKIIH